MSDTSDQSRVLTFDSSKAYERPITVIHEGIRYDITEIEDRWIATGVEASSPVFSGFVVRCRGGARFKLEHNPHTGWRVAELPSIKIVPESG